VRSSLNVGHQVSHSYWKASDTPGVLPSPSAMCTKFFAVFISLSEHMIGQCPKIVCVEEIPNPPFYIVHNDSCIRIYRWLIDSCVI
jgi:hypothetical protein